MALNLPPDAREKKLPAKLELSRHRQPGPDALREVRSFVGSLRCDVDTGPSLKLFKWKGRVDASTLIEVLGRIATQKNLP